MNTMSFDMQVLLQQLLDESYRLLGALPLLMLALLILWLGWLLGGWLTRRAVLTRIAGSNPFMSDLARTTVRWATLAIAALVALEIMDATALLGAVLGTAGVLGVALGFAFKDTLENYLAGILMSLRQPFAPRDHVVIAGNEGVVIAMTSRATILMTLDGNHLRLPNALVFRSVMLNYTRNPSRRFEFDVGVGVGEDLLLAQQIGVEKLRQIPGVLQQPPPRAFITALGDSNVQLRFHGWVDQRSSEFVMVKSEAIRIVKLALEEAGMDMPEPIYRLQITERIESAEVKPQPRRASSAHVAPDTRAVDDLQQQIDKDRSRQGRQDLLDPAAPQE
jgi:small conductance mechanosensitive channel